MPNGVNGGIVHGGGMGAVAQTAQGIQQRSHNKELMAMQERGATQRASMQAATQREGMAMQDKLARDRMAEELKDKQADRDFAKGMSEYQARLESERAERDRGWENEDWTKLMGREKELAKERTATDKKQQAFDMFKTALNAKMMMGILRTISADTAGRIGAQEKTYQIITDAQAQRKLLDNARGEMGSNLEGLVTPSKLATIMHNAEASRPPGGVGPVNYRPGTREIIDYPSQAILKLKDWERNNGRPYWANKELIDGTAGAVVDEVLKSIKPELIGFTNLSGDEALRGLEDAIVRGEVGPSDIALLDAAYSRIEEEFGKYTAEGSSETMMLPKNFTTGKSQGAQEFDIPKEVYAGIKQRVAHYRSRLRSLGAAGKPKEVLAAYDRGMSMAGTNYLANILTHLNQQTGGYNPEKWDTLLGEYMGTLREFAGQDWTGMTEDDMNAMMSRMFDFMGGATAGTGGK